MLSAILGLDIGTTSVSVVAINTSGIPLASVTLPHNAAVIGLPEGYAEQDPAALWKVTCDALRQIRNAVPDYAITAIGLTGQMHSTLLLDSDGRPVTNIITWQDKRSIVHHTNNRSLLDQLLSSVNDVDMLPTGCQLAAGYLGTTIFALQQLQQWPASATRVTFVADWIAARLCEQRPVTDRSHAASSGLYDLQHDCWNPTLLARAACNPAWLPDVVDSGAVIGTVSTKAATQTGLPAGVKVCNAIGDNQASVLSSLPRTAGVLLINIGTGGQIAWRIPGFQRVAGLDTRYLPSLSSTTAAPQHEYMLVGAGLCGGDTIAWINRTIRQWLEAFGVQKSEAEVWQSLVEQMDALPPDMPPLHCEPFFRGTRPDPERRGILSNIGSSNFIPANVARSILSGMADTLFAAFRNASDHFPEPLTRIVMSGNGARRNPLLLKAIAERFAVPAAVAECREEAAIGAAILAGVMTDS
ncbi:MAG: FGGY family carbohydrate kinase [Planctomycetaceae bacterium]